MESNKMPSPGPPSTLANHASAAKRASKSQSQWQLILKRFVKHKLALASVFVILLLYLIAMGAEFCPL